MNFFPCKLGRAVAVATLCVPALAIARCESFPVHEQQTESLNRCQDTPSKCSHKHCGVNVNGDSDVSGMTLIQVNARRTYSLQPNADGDKEEERLHVGAQIGDLRVPKAPMNKASKRYDSKSSPTPIFDDVDELKANQRTLACNKYMHWYDTSSRLALMLLTSPFHGSTAMEGVLMSSKHLATLCTFRTWECEGRTIMEANGYASNDAKWDFSAMLDLYSEYWNLHRPVLFDKSLKVGNPASMRHGIDFAEIPRRMVDTGITRLDRAYVLLWRPLCLRSLSKHASNASHIDFLNVETWHLSALMHRHHELLLQGDAVLVINLADLLWRPLRNEDRLNDFLPCLGNINVSYVPQLGHDIYPENYWKADGSVVDFGKSVDPLSFYDVEEQHCLVDEPMDELSVKEQDTTFASIEYLRSFS